jgi:hypothetical protein
MRREELEWEDPTRVQVPKQGTGAEGLVVARMAVKAAGAKGSRHLVTTVGQLGNEEEPFARDEAVFDFEEDRMGSIPSGESQEGKRRRRCAVDGGL